MPSGSRLRAVRDTSGLLTCSGITRPDKHAFCRRTARRPHHPTRTTQPAPPKEGLPMKLGRFGAPGAEKPGLVDAQCVVHDLYAHVNVINRATLSPARLD